MSDSERQKLARFVYAHLRDPDFRSRLQATAPDGTKPIVALLPSDPTQDLLGQLDALGGSANVVLGIANGALIFAMHQSKDETGDEHSHVLTSECTVGVFLARVLADGGGQYQFAGPGEATERGSAELVGLAS